MECSTVKELIYEYVLKELEEENCRRVEEHLANCSDCNTEYNTLENLLINTAKPLVDLKNDIELPTDLNKNIFAALNKKKRVTPIRLLIAACLTIIIFYTVPVFAYYASQVFPIDKYVHFLDKDLIGDFKEGRGQVIGKSSEMNGVKFTVDGMIKRGDRYSILFTIKVVPNDEYNYGMPPSSGPAIITVQDQFGKKYSLGSASGSSERALKEGEFQYIFEIAEPLSFWSYKLNIRITAIELGYTNEKEKKYFVKYKNVYGDWQVGFNINRSLDRREK